MTIVRESRAPKSAAHRREQVLEAALLLFNAEGTALVSTNHIAAAAGVSPGNLYYWFPNKGAIVRALFEQWSAASALTLDTVDPAAILSSLVAAVRHQAGLTERFAVFARELVPLLHADPTLAQLYRDNYAERIEGFVQIVEILVENGLIRPPEPPADIRSLVEITWIATEYTPSFLDAIGAPHDADSAVRIVAAPLFAQLTTKGRAVLESAGLLPALEAPH